jgi:predicted RND superfamily exporter protein
LEARQFVANGSVVEDAELVDRALRDPLWSRTLVSTDGTVGAIVVDLSSTEGEALATAMNSIRNAIAPYEAAGFSFYIVGEAAVSVAAQEAGRNSAVRAGVFTGGMLFLTLMALIRSLPAVLASLISIGVASVWTIGLLPVFGWQQSHLSSGAATLILVLGCADCVHFVTHYLEVGAKFSDRVEGLSATSNWVLAPCLLTTATTVGAFLSFSGGDVLALKQFGVMAAIGVSLAFLLTFSLLPALLLVLRPRPRRLHYSEAWQEILKRLARFGARRRVLVLAVSIVLAVLGALGVPKLRIEMNVEELWGPHHPVTRAIDFVSLHLQRADRLEIEIRLPEDVRIEEPQTLQELADVETALVAVDRVGRSHSLVSLLRHAHGLVSAARAEDKFLPGSEAAIGELLFLISSGSPGALDQVLTVDQRYTRLSLEVENLSMIDRARLLENVDRLLRTQLPEGWNYEVTGPVVLTYRFGREFGRSQTNIVSASSILVTVLIGAYLRSVSWALLAVIPNAVALILMFGSMGHWGMLLNFGSAIVAPIAIGIAADDTIHFLTAYSRDRRKGRDVISALEGAISGVGEAVVTTAVALSLGFLSMMTSPMATVADMGVLCAIAIIGATLADLLVLPALIATVAEWRGFQRLPGRHG